MKSDQNLAQNITYAAGSYLKAIKYLGGIKDIKQVFYFGGKSLSILGKSAPFIGMAFDIFDTSNLLKSNDSKDFFEVQLPLLIESTQKIVDFC